MKSKHEDIDQRFLLLFKLDAMRLFERVSERREDYVKTFSLKRTRSVFKEIFECRYHGASINDLSHCPLEVIESLAVFHKEIDNLYWYLKHTEDMPNMIEDNIERRLVRLKKHFDMLTLYIDAELSGLPDLPEEDANFLLPSEEDSMDQISVSDSSEFETFEEDSDDNAERI